MSSFFPEMKLEVVELEYARRASEQPEDTTPTAVLSNCFDQVNAVDHKLISPVTSLNMPVLKDDYIPQMSLPGKSLHPCQSLPTQTQNTFRELVILQKLPTRSILLPCNRRLVDEAFMDIVDAFVHGRNVEEALEGIVPSQILPLASVPYFGFPTKVQAAINPSSIAMDWTHTFLHLARVSFSHFCHPTISPHKRYAILQALNELYMRYQYETGREVPQMQDMELESLANNPRPYGVGDERRWHMRISKGLRNLMQRQNNGELVPATDTVFSIDEFLDVLDIYAI